MIWREAVPQVAAKEGVAGAVPVTAEEDRLLRAAVRLYGGQADARAIAVIEVACYQRLYGGQ